MARAFSERAFQDAEGLVAVHAWRFAEQVGARPDGAAQGDWTPPRNMGDWATYYGFDFVSDLGYW